MIDISNSRQPRLIASQNVGATVRDIAACDAVAYVATDDGLHSIDLSRPSRPRLAYFVSGDTINVRVHDRLLVATDLLLDPSVYSVDDRLKPTLVGKASLPMVNFADAAIGDGVWCAAAEDTFLVVDLSIPSRPELASRLDTPLAHAMSVAAAYGYAFATSWHAAHLWIVDATRPESLEVAGSVEVGLARRGLAVDGRTAYVETDEGVAIVDVSRPVSPSLKGRLEGQLARSITSVADVAYGVDGSDLWIADVSDAEHPTIAGQLALEAAVSVAVDGGTAYVGRAGRMDAPYAGGLHTVDVSEPAFLRELSQLPLEGSAFDIAISRSPDAGSRSHIWIAEAAAGGENDLDLIGLRAVDVSQPSASRSVSFLAAPGFYREGGFPQPSLVLSGDHAYVTDHFEGDSYGQGAVWIVSVADPRAPVTIDWIPTLGLAIDLDVYDGHVYVADLDAGLLVYRIVR